MSLPRPQARRIALLIIPALASIGLADATPTTSPAPSRMTYDSSWIPRVGGPTPAATPAESTIFDRLRSGPVTMEAFLSGLLTSISSPLTGDGYLVSASAGAPSVDGIAPTQPQIARMSRMTADRGTDLVIGYADADGAHLRMVDGRTGDPWHSLDLTADLSIIAFKDPYSCVGLVTIEIDVDERGFTTNNGELAWVELQQTIKRRNSCGGSFSPWQQSVFTGRILTQTRSGANPYTKVHAVSDVIASVHSMAPFKTAWPYQGDLAVLMVMGGSAAVWDLPEFPSSGGGGLAGYLYTLRHIQETWGYEGSIRFPASDRLVVIDMLDLYGHGWESHALVQRDNALELWSFGVTFSWSVHAPGFPLWTRLNERHATPIVGMTMPPGRIEPVRATDLLIDQSFSNNRRVDGTTGRDEWLGPRGMLHDLGDLDGDGNADAIAFSNVLDHTYGLTSYVDGATGNRRWSQFTQLSFSAGWFAFGGLPRTADGTPRWITWQHRDTGPLRAGLRAYAVETGGIVWEVDGTPVAVRAAGDPVEGLTDLVLVLEMSDQWWTFESAHLRDTETGEFVRSVDLPASWNGLSAPVKLADIDNDGIQDAVIVLAVDGGFEVRMDSSTLPAWTLMVQAL